jgi:hypothetical protein
MIYTVTAWEDGCCVWENMYDSKPKREQVIDDMLRDGIYPDSYDDLSIQKEPE